MNPISFYLSIDLAYGNEGLVGYEYQTVDRYNSLRSFPSNINGPSWNFDSRTRINVCSGKDDTSPISCTVSDFQIFYEDFSGQNGFAGYLGGTTRIILANKNFFNRQI